MYNAKIMCLSCGEVDHINEDGLCPVCEEVTIMDGDILTTEDA